MSSLFPKFYLSFSSTTSCILMVLKLSFFFFIILFLPHCCGSIAFLLRPLHTHSRFNTWASSLPSSNAMGGFYSTDQQHPLTNVYLTQIQDQNPTCSLHRCQDQFKLIKLLPDNIQQFLDILKRKAAATVNG